MPKNNMYQNLAFYSGKINVLENSKHQFYLSK